MIEPIKEYHRYVHTDAATMWDEPELNPIRSNTIINKVITGWGATYSEIRSNRNSILVLPHKNQIEDKHKFHKDSDNTFPVTEKFKISQLIKHISNSKGKHVKFLTTPEGLKKVIAAVEATGGNAYTDYFLLIDECQKLTKDIKFRVNISVAMEDFFLFKSKAMISATPIVPSDPRFVDFELVKVIHKRNVKKKIHIHKVNNMGAAFHEYIKNYDGEMLFVFFSTINGIHSLITKNDLVDQANIYCSEDGVKDFRDKNLSRAYSQIDPSKLAKFNFLTGSFFNGLDIHGFDAMPDILILTDIQYIDHTIIDPNTDSYQILGRFRQKDPLSKLGDRYRTATHIINTKHIATFKLEAQALELYQLSKMRYESVLVFQATTNDPFLIEEVCGESLKRIFPYSNLLKPDGQLDHFKYDNYFYEERVKMCYGYYMTIGLAYEFSELFETTESTTAYLDDELVPMSKGMRRYSKPSIIRVCQQVIELERSSDANDAEQKLKEVKRRFPLIYKAIERLGINRLEELDYNKKAIEKELLKLDIAEKRVHQPLIDIIFKTLMVGISYKVSAIKEKMQSAFAEYGITANAKGTDIKTYFEVREFTGHIPLTKKEMKMLDEADGKTITTFELDGVKKKSVRMIKIIARKHNIINPYSTREKRHL